MKLHADEFYAFALGGALVWVLSYLHFTRDRRTVGAIKSNIETLAAYHNLSEGQYKLTQFGPLFTRNAITDEEILVTYAYVRRIMADKMLGGAYKKISPTILAAEIILCERVLGLTRVHAIRALLRSHTMNDVQKTFTT